MEVEEKLQPTTLSIPLALRRLRVEVLGTAATIHPNILMGHL